MGVIFSRFKRKKTTLEVLEALEKNIKSIEENRLHTEQRERKIVGQLILYSVGVYVLAAIFFYLYYFPASLYDQLFYITPLLVFPVIVVFVKRLLTWYYRRKISRDQEKLTSMRKQKEKLLEEVKDKETYKIAKEILEKFAPDQLKKVPDFPSKVLAIPTVGKTGPVTPAQRAQLVVSHTPTDIRRRVNVPSGTSVPPALMASSESMGVVVRSNGQGYVRPPGPPMPRAILPRDRTYIDKFMEYLVGDGPNNRYALICRQCESHNGMALKEEFEYLGFRCCYCYYWNPARKQRPQAPRLPSPVVGSPDPGEDSSSEVQSGTDTDSDDESHNVDRLEKKDPEELNEDQQKSEAVHRDETQEMHEQTVQLSTIEEMHEQTEQLGTLETATSIEKQMNQESDDLPASVSLDS